MNSKCQQTLANDCSGISIIFFFVLKKAPLFFADRLETAQFIKPSLELIRITLSSVNSNHFNIAAVKGFVAQT
ncbi:hypothetical protein [Acinetobacter baumannii]|uniref:hypothetical protein n=1 Tax=Acinetobacter baumannii TaxID=470 RepID=UPI001315329A|nr:hypothetical protein [Acinetobacter baumannii]